MGLAVVPMLDISPLDISELIESLALSQRIAKRVATALELQRLLSFFLPVPHAIVKYAQAGLIPRLQAAMNEA